jgi:hypothetical protein
MRAHEFVVEKWSNKYKKSINCSSPKGFSQKAHCAGRKKNEDVAEGLFGIDDKIKGQIQNVVSDLSDIPGMWDHKAQTFTDAGMEKLKSVLKNNPKYIKYALNLTYRDYEAEDLDENLRKWFKDKWVRFGPDGKIRGDCARGSEKEGKPKCLPQAKAHSLGKKGRATAAARKRREDPNANRSGKAINVKTK